MLGILWIIQFEMPCHFPIPSPKHPSIWMFICILYHILLQQANNSISKMFWSSLSLWSKFIEPKEVMETSDYNQWVRTDYSLHSRGHLKSKECSWTFPFLASQPVRSWGTSWACHRCPKDLGPPRRTEPWTCGITHFLRVERARMELNHKTRS